MSKVNWEVVTDSAWADCLGKTVEEVAELYVNEVCKNEPDYDHANALYELGQARFSAELNNRENRVALFRIWCQKEFAKRGI